MSQTVKPTVFGATGRTGQQLVRQARGLQVTDLARCLDALQINSPSPTVVTSDVLDPSWHGTGIGQLDAMLSALGQFVIDHRPAGAEDSRAR